MEIVARGGRRLVIVPDHDIRQRRAARIRHRVGKRDLATRLKNQAGREIGVDTGTVRSTAAATTDVGAKFILGRELIVRQEVFLRPGQTVRLSKGLSSEARAIAVVAAFREYQAARWRAVEAVPMRSVTNDESSLPIQIRVSARDIKFANAR